MKLEKLRFLKGEQVRDIAKQFETPVFVYSRKLLEQQADKALAFPNAFGLTVRYAMKANPNLNILRIFHNKGIKIDASSEYEVERAALAGIPPENILLTSQQFPVNLEFIVDKAVEFNACSLYQLEQYGERFPNSSVSVRINPGLGSGGTDMTNTGGPASSFGIWHEYLNDVFCVAKNYDLNIKRVHTHIGSGSDPEIWKKVALMSLNIVKKFINKGHKVKILNLGGGYKVGRMANEKSTDLQECGMPVKQAFIAFAEQTERQLRLEVEPGTFLVANAGALVSKVIDVVSTVYKEGVFEYDFEHSRHFIKIDSGMTEITRPSLYGAQHPIIIVPKTSEERGTEKYVVVGHCCESGDLVSPKLDEPGTLSERLLCEAKIGDFLVIEGSGAYCSSMNVKGYNSFPAAAEVLIDTDREVSLIKRRQTMEHMLQNEVTVVKKE